MQWTGVVAMVLAMGGIVSADSTPKKPTEKPAAKKPAAKPSPALAQVEDDPKLPRVLLIGDSISMGYTLDVRELLKGKANVHRPPTNCGPTATGLAQLDKWLAVGSPTGGPAKKWDVIHFNWGLHDLKYVDDKGTMVDVAKGKQLASPEQYEKNLRELVSKLKATGAKLIWCATTPVPEGTTGRQAGDDAKYNLVAEKVMKEQGVQINDLNAFAKPRLAEIQLPKNVHYSPAGSKVLAAEVAGVIEKALKP
ncbi:SGNH/GDSL hydrolase family protein [Humisphaera borealis]|uniref:SGNH/GDSL hydrolase family protein n=2 Tax=Humisphaera borealis TaxID=2807512 RepID=A0A7M2X3V3_9BACT|nr:SGNH/GDSL hydrolase family protein [Humisphaera borealis]